MQTPIINASIQLVPLAPGPEAIAHIDEAIRIIRASGLPFEVGPFGTSVEGSFEQVMQLLGQLHHHMAGQPKAEWLLNIQLHGKAGANSLMRPKTEKHR